MRPECLVHVLINRSVYMIWVVSHPYRASLWAGTWAESSRWLCSESPLLLLVCSHLSFRRRWTGDCRKQSKTPSSLIGQQTHSTWYVSCVILCFNPGIIYLCLLFNMIINRVNIFFQGPENELWTRCKCQWAPARSIIRWQRDHVIKMMGCVCVDWLIERERDL